VLVSTGEGKGDLSAFDAKTGERLLASTAARA